MTELQQVLEAVKTLGAEGKSTFIWYLVITWLAYPIVMALSIAGCLWLTRYTIQSVVLFIKKANEV